MALIDSKRLFEKSAGTLGNYAEMTLWELTEGYYQAENKSPYFSAIILHYWYKIYKYEIECASLNLDESDLLDMMRHSIMYALNHASWKDESKHISKEATEKAIDKVFNQCFKSTRLIRYQEMNKAVRKANTQTYSIDKLIEDEGDMANDLLGLTTDLGVNVNIKLLVESFLKRGKTYEALVIDGIVNGDSFKNTKQVNNIRQYKYSESDDESGRKLPAVEIEQVEVERPEFNPRLLVKHLTNLDDNYINLFINTYNVSNRESFIQKINQAKNKSHIWYHALDSVIEKIKQSPELLSYLRG